MLGGGEKRGVPFLTVPARKDCSSSEISFACFGLPNVAGRSGVSDVLVHNPMKV